MNKEQKELQMYNNKIMNAISKPYSPAELQEIAEHDGWN